MMTTKRRASLGPTLFLVLGVAILCSGIVLHLALPARYERVELIPVVVGAAIALFAAYWMDPPRAKGAAEVVTEAGGKIVHSAVEFRTGQSEHDPVVRIEKTSDPTQPEKPDEVTVSVTSEAGAPNAAPPPAEPLVNPVAWKHGRDDGVL